MNKDNLPMIPFGKSKDITGQKFGKLTVLGRDANTGNGKKSRVYVWCECDCEEHNIISVLKDNLTSNKIQSCGCLRKEKAKEHIIKINNSRKLDLTGQVFGYLKVLEEDKEKTKINQHYYWKCKCLKCNKNIYSVRTDQLTSGKTTVCNYCNEAISMGEHLIIKLLSENNIPFETQKTFESCRFPDTNAYAKFDFYVNKQYLIEFDGQQHFSNSSSNFFNVSFDYIKQHDEYKNKWCKENNIPLIRIPYYKIQSLTIDDLKIKEDNNG